MHYIACIILYNASMHSKSFLDILSQHHPPKKIVVDVMMGLSLYRSGDSLWCIINIYIKLKYIFFWFAHLVLSRCLPAISRNIAP